MLYTCTHIKSVYGTNMVLLIAENKVFLYFFNKMDLLVNFIIYI